MINRIAIIVALICLHQTFALDPFSLQIEINPESEMVARIISNFLQKYFCEKNIFITVFVDLETTTLTSDIYRFHQDLLTDLWKNNLDPIFSLSAVHMKRWECFCLNITRCITSSYIFLKLFWFLSIPIYRSLPAFQRRRRKALSVMLLNNYKTFL